MTGPFKEVTDDPQQIPDSKPTFDNQPYINSPRTQISEDPTIAQKFGSLTIYDGDTPYDPAKSNSKFDPTDDDGRLSKNRPSDAMPIELDKGRSDEAPLRDDQGRIISQTTAWGQQDIQYKGDTDTVDRIVFTDSNGDRRTYVRQPDGSMRNPGSGDAYQDIYVYKDDGRINFTERDGSGELRYRDGSIDSFNSNKQRIYRYDPNFNTGTTYEYPDGRYDSAPSRTVTRDLRTNRIISEEIPAEKNPDVKTG